MSITLCKRQIIKILALLLFAIVIICVIFFGQGTGLGNLFCNQQMLEQMLCDGMPVFYIYNKLNIENVAKGVVGFDINSPISVLQNNVYAFNAIIPPETEEEEVEVPTPAEAKPIKATTITAGNSVSNLGVNVKNATTYEINVEQMLSEPLNFNFEKKGPKVLVVHSHSSESYTVTDKNYYLPTDPDRTEDKNFNVVRVGTQIVDTLKEKGIEVVHDTDLHDYPSYNGSYKSSLASVEKYLKKYPSIRIVLDIHRDSMVQADGTKLKLVADVDGKKAAQIMLLTGTNQGGLDHPDWRENLKFAVKLQKVINDMYPGLARPVSLTKERYNTHSTKGSIIIEMGTTGNTLEEALVSAQMVGNAVAEFIKTN